MKSNYSAGSWIAVLFAKAFPLLAGTRAKLKTRLVSITLLSGSVATSLAAFM